MTLYDNKYSYFEPFIHVLMWNWMYKDSLKYTLGDFKRHTSLIIRGFFKDTLIHIMTTLMCL